MHCQQFIPRWLVCVVLLCGVNSLRAAEAFPPGWLPVNQLDGKPTWREVRDIKDRIHLYLPRGKGRCAGYLPALCFIVATRANWRIFGILH